MKYKRKLGESQKKGKGKGDIAESKNSPGLFFERTSISLNFPTFEPLQHGRGVTFLNSLPPLSRTKKKRIGRGEEKSFESEEAPTRSYLLFAVKILQKRYMIVSLLFESP